MAHRGRGIRAPTPVCAAVASVCRTVDRHAATRMRGSAAVLVCVGLGRQTGGLPGLLQCASGPCVVGRADARPDTKGCRTARPLPMGRALPWSLSDADRGVTSDQRRRWRAGRRARVRRLSRHSRAVRQLHALLMPSRQLRGGLPAHGTRRSNDVGFLRIRHPQAVRGGGMRPRYRNGFRHHFQGCNTSGKRASRRSAAAKAWRRISSTAGAKNSLRPARSGCWAIRHAKRRRRKSRTCAAKTASSSRSWPRRSSRIAYSKKIWWSPVRGTTSVWPTRLPPSGIRRGPRGPRDAPSRAGGPEPIGSPQLGGRLRRDLDAASTRALRCTGPLAEDDERSGVRQCAR